MKKTIFALTILSFLSIPEFANGQYLLDSSVGSSKLQEECAKYAKEVEVVFKSSYGRLRYDKSKSQEAIKRIAQKGNFEVVNGYQMMGLADFSSKVSVSLQVVSINMKKGLCVIPETVDVFFGFEDPVIYIAREAQKTRCKEKLVTRHEQTHMQISILALEYFLPQMKKIAYEHAQKIKPVFVSSNEDRQAIIDRMMERFVAKMTDLSDQFSRHLHKEQDKLDNLENYNYESSVCP